LALSAGGRRYATPFRWLGRFVYRRRRYIVVAWIIALVALVPIIMKEGSVTSLQQGSATGSALESIQASDLISAQFPKSVPNSTLLVAISGPNVTSTATQVFVNQLVHYVKDDSGIAGLNQTVDVFSPLYSAINGANRATYSAIKGANSTSHLLFGVPALYLGAWQRAYASGHNITMSDDVAYNSTAAALDSANSTSYRLYSSHVLSLFSSDWAASWSNGQLAGSAILTRGSVVARDSGIQYIDSYMASSKSFGSSLLQSTSLAEFINDTHAQWDARLSGFALSYVTNSTGFSARFVTSAYALGRAYGNSSLYTLAGSIVWKPADYGLTRGLASLISSLVSPARDITLVSLGLSQSVNQNVIALRAAVTTVTAQVGSNSGVQSALVTGGDAISYDFGNSAQSDLGLILPVTIILLLVATGLFFRSVLTPFITLGTIGVGLGISQVFIVLVGTYIAKVDFTIPTILLTVMIGVGTDYSVFVIARYREERVRGEPVQQAIETSVTWAGESIATSGATVIISFLALTFTSVVFLRTMGFVVGLGVLIALSIALTMVPAIVSIVGGRTFWPYSGDRFARYSVSVLSKLQRKRGYFSRSGAFAVKRAGILIVLALVATAPALYVYANTTPTFDFLSAAPSSLDSVMASNQLTASFGGGSLYPTYVVMTFAQPVVVGHLFDSSEMSVIQSASSYLVSSPDVRNLTSPTMPYGQPVAYQNVNYSSVSGRQTFSAMLQSIGKDNKTVLFTINFAIDPYSTQAITDAQAIRQSLHQSYNSAPGVTGVYVGGASGSILDTKIAFDSQFNSIVPIVAVGVALVLLVVLGSLFLPVFAVLSVLMSIVWTLAATKLVFQQLYSYEILFITPFFLFVTLLGLGMDYNIFILTRIREEATKGKHLNDAIVGAIEQTGGIITAAAIILAGSLGSLMLSSDLLLKQIGFSFAYSILIDALVVRTYLVPAVMSKVGKWNWYNPIPYLNRSRSLFESENAPSNTA
jgi:putative drug exporter of the RND superfamily